MDDSDDDFKELCASFYQRVKKNGPKEVSGERRTQKASNSSQIRSKLKGTKPTASRNKTLQGPAERKTQSGSRVPRTQKQGAPKQPQSQPAPPENGEGGVCASAVHRDSAWSAQTEAPGSSSQPPPPCLTATVPSPSKPRAAELVLQRMQQFKRADPERLKHASAGCSLEAAPEEDDPKGPQEAVTAGNGSGPGLPATDSDTSMPLILQQEFGQEPAPTRDDSLEDKGLFFCQICQKNLSAMNVTRREQHVNRCLDEAEKALRPSVPQVPECPICGKPFLRPKSRLSHLKQCAARMEVGPQLLLQAVRLQTAQPEGASSTPVPSLGSPLGGLKRKGAATKKEPRKRRKVAEPEVPSEDLLVAMALSRSEMEREAVPAALRLGSAFSGKTRLGAEKKSRKKKAPVSPPRLLLQDAEMAGRQLEERVARLLAEEEEAAAERASTPPLPASRLLRGLEEGSGRLQPPGRRQSFLWEGSALTGAWALESFYTESLVPSLVPPRPAELAQEPMLPPVLSDPPEPGPRTPPAVHSARPGGHSPRDPAPSASQREHQALQDLLDLAGEGLSASLQPCSGGPAGTGGEAGMDLSPGGLPLTGFVLPAKEKHAERGDQASLSLGLLVADFGAMVNNPHLSDVQFQTDSGEVLYAHKFVLYARCPLLMQHVNSEGFFASEDGDVRAQRVLLSDVSTEAACVFLHYLYTADAALPPRLAPDLSSLAHRFGVSELVHLCEQVPVGPDSGGEQRKEQEDEDCESRGETFRELLRSVWRGEEGAEALSKSEGREEDDREEVNEEEMEEIYEFAATQRTRLQAGGAPEVEEEAEQLQEDAPASAGILGSTEDKEESENAEQMASSGQGRDEAPAPRKNVREATRLPLGDPAAGREERAEAQEEGLGHSCCPGPAQGQADRGDSTPLCSVDAAAVAEQPSSSPLADGPEPSWRTSDRQEGDGSVWERGVDSSHPPAHQQAPPLCSHFVPSQPPRGRSPRRPHPPHTSALCPPAPQLPGTPPRAPSSSSPPKTRGVRSLPPPPEDPGREDEGCESVLEHRGKEILLAPEKSPCADPTQAKPGCSSAKSHDSLSSVNREDEIILLLDSDEELELEQTRRMSVLKGPPEGRKVLEVSTKSSELFPIIDVDEDQEPSQSPPGREATLQWEVEGLLGNRGSVGGRRTPQLFGDPQSSSDEDSTTDSSWLVPATPLASKSRDCSSQTRITGLRSRPSADPTARPKPSTRVENRRDLEAMPKFSVIVPQTSSSRLGPVAPGSPGSRRQVCRSLSSPHPQHHQPFSPLAPCPLAGGLADVTGRFQRSLPPVPSPAGQASASEVVEVEDSDDEQEVASRQVNSSPLLDRDPPMPADDWCWHVEPLSPIPIDHLNLERTGPLSTSSPSSRAGGAPDSRGCLSPAAPMATPPLRTGSRTGRRKSHEKSPGAGSPGGSRLSFLNSALWDDWDGEEQKSPQGLPLAQPPPSKLWELQTPKGANQKNLPPKVPITPLPRYSLMETPELRKELDRFGVRPLPKRQMVLKLKEIFQYTHQTLPSDSEDEGQSSRVPLEAPCSQTLTTRASKASGVAGHTPLEATSGPIPQRSKGPAKTKGLQHPKQQPGGSVPGLSMSPAKEGPPGPDSDAQLPASQESTASSVDSSDSSCRSQSSSCESGAALESAGDEESEEGVSASQAADQAAATEEAVRRCIRSRPALYRKVLLYQPFELAELQAELKQQGICVATGKLLDFLDAHCITFTTAAARKEKLGRKRRQPLGKKRGRRAGQPGPPSTPPAVSSPQGSAPPQ